jgi:fructokinase
VILVIGEILFDVFPNYRRLGGAPFNFAYHLKNFGFDVRFISRIGMDDTGKEILHKLELFEFDLDDIQLDDVHPTGTVNVHLDKSGVPQFDIISNVAYDYIEYKPAYHLDLINEAQLIYFGSLIQRSETGYKNLQKFISVGASEALNFYDINLRPGCYNNAIIEKSLSKTDILKLSTEELGKLRQLLSVRENNAPFIQYLVKEYALNTVSLTKGASGSALFTNQGSFSSDAAEAVNVADSVGAGDAYAAMLAAGILRDWQPEEILQQASSFAARICEIRGAIPDSLSFYEPFKPLFRNGCENAIA